MKKLLSRLIALTSMSAFTAGSAYAGYRLSCDFIKGGLVQQRLEVFPSGGDQGEHNYLFEKLKGKDIYEALVRINGNNIDIRINRNGEYLFVKTGKGSPELQAIHQKNLSIGTHGETLGVSCFFASDFSNSDQEN